MNLDGEPVYVGRDCGGQSLALDRAVVDHYMRSVDDHSALYEEYVPGLVLHSECYRDLSWYLRNIFGNLHARQEWELYHAVPVGTRVETRSFIRERYRKRGRDYVVKETWTLDGDGRLVTRGLTHQSFLVEDEEVDRSKDVVGKDTEKRSKPKVDISAGDGPLLEPVHKTVDEQMCMLFSGPGKNYHNDKQEARNLGFPDIVVQGMLPICIVSELLTREFGTGWLAGGKMDVRLVNVLWGGESIRATGRIREETPEEDRTRVHLNVWAEKDDGTKVIIGQASALR